jgi:hypothetical protein
MEYKIIDADGHVIEDDSLFDYLDSSYRAHDHQLSWDRLFPSLDFHHIGGHSTRNKKSFGGGKRVGPKEWMEFVEMADIEYAVLFPTKWATHWQYQPSRLGVLRGARLQRLAV